MSIKLTLITVDYDAEQGGFVSDPLSAVEGEILSVAEHFFVHLGCPHLLLVVHHRTSSESTERRPQSTALPRPADAGVRAELSEPERLLFDRLRAWRNSRAQTEGVPPYVLLTNRQLAEVARRQPATLSALREISGIGEAKASRFGNELLLALASIPSTNVAASPAGTSLSSA